MCRGAPCVKAHDSQTGEHPGSSPWTSVVDWLLGFNDFAAAQAGRADAHALRGSTHLGVNRPQVDVPAPFAHVVGVTDRIAAHRLLTANLTNLCHRTALQNLSELDVQSIDCTGFDRPWPASPPVIQIAAKGQKLHRTSVRQLLPGFSWKGRTAKSAILKSCSPR